jgi:hypothetical protein
MFFGVDRNEADADLNAHQEDCQAQDEHYDGRAAGRHVPTKFERADGGTGHGQPDDCEREGRKPAVLCRRLVGRDVVGRAELLALRLHCHSLGGGKPRPRQVVRLPEGRARAPALSSSA